MTASDVLLRQFAAMAEERAEHWGILSPGLEALWALTCALAAEVRELRSELAVNEEIRLAFEASNAELRRDRDYLDRLQGGPYFVVRLDSADALNRENVERFRGMGIIRLLDADAAMAEASKGGRDGE